MDRYKGYYEVILNEDEQAEIYSNEAVRADIIGAHCPLVENCYYLILNENGELVDKFIYQANNFKKVNFVVINNKYTKTIKPRNRAQELAIDMLNDKNTKVKLIQGVYGSGKDYLMLHQALSLLEKGKFKKIVFIRPNVTVANVPEIGYLKGTMEEKLAWTLGPFYDKVGGEEGVEYLTSQGMLEMVPLLFIRGRSFDDAIIYITEGQNITSEIAKLIISRVGDNSELWINADNHQTDKRIYDQDNGISKIIERLRGHRLFGYVYLDQTERGEVAELCTLLDD